MADSSYLTGHFRSAQLEQHLQALYQTVLPSVVALETHFLGPENRDLKHPYSHDTGVFIGPTTILTSAKVVGRVFPNKPESSALHKCYLAHTMVISRDNKPLRTTPLAVSFSHDVAVLELLPPPQAEGEGQISFPHVPIAKSPPEEGHVLVAIIHMLNLQIGMMPGHVRAVGEKTFKAKAPWPLDDKSGWVEFDNSQFNGGFPRPDSYLYSSKEEIVGELSSMMTGSPLFNIDGELVGVGSWDVRETGSSFPVGFGASLLPIMVAVEYAKNKKPGDPTVMDDWIQDCSPDKNYVMRRRKVK